MRGYDEWLESPYTNAARQEAAYESWCESRGLDAAEDHWDAFDEFCEAQREDY